MEDIVLLREKIDEIDSELIRLFQERMDVVNKIAAYKKSSGMNTDDPQREENIIRKHLDDVKEQYKPYYLEFQQTLFRLSKQYQQEQ